MKLSQITRRQWMAQTIGASLVLAGCERAAPGEGGSPAGGDGKGFRIGLIYFGPEEGADTCMNGLFAGAAEKGIERGRNLEVLSAHANGEIASIPQLVQNYDTQNLNAIVTLTTPCLQAACSMAKNTPVVFTYVYDPIAAGAGTSRADHLPHVTGVGSFPPVEDTVDVIAKLVPGIKAVGTVYNSSEANSNKVIGVAREAFSKRNIKLEEVTATSTAEVFQSAQVVSQRSVQALWVTGDNTALQSFDAIVKAAGDAKLPLIINDPEFTARGALISVGLGWREAGLAAGGILARVLNGEQPRNIPFEEVAVKKVTINNEVAKKLGITIPAEIASQAV